MRTNAKKLETIIIVAILGAGAFAAGSRMRGWQGTTEDITQIPHMKTLQASALLKLTPECDPVKLSNVPAGDNQNRQLVKSVYNLLKTQYVEPITSQKETEMARGAVRGMLSSLSDPDSRFLDPKERKLVDDAAGGRLHGIGAILALKTETGKAAADKPGKTPVIPGKTPDAGATFLAKIIVVAPMPGSPAEKAGVQPGDSITHVNGKWIITYNPFEEPGFVSLEKKLRNKEIKPDEYQKALDATTKKLNDGVTIWEALESLTDKSKGKVTLTVDRPGESKPIELSAECRDTVIDPVTTKTMASNVQYIRITQFNSEAAKLIASDIRQARERKTKGIILDLRNDPGGQLASAKSIIGDFTGGGSLGILVGKDARHPMTAPVKPGVAVPVVVMVNGGTASVAELTAGSLRDRGVAKIVGTKTFGDALTQTPLVLKDGSVAVITTGKMLTAKGTDFQDKGLDPDKKVEARAGRRDVQLEEALRLL